MDVSLQKECSRLYYYYSITSKSYNNIIIPLPITAVVISSHKIYFVSNHDFVISTKEILYNYCGK